VARGKLGTAEALGVARSVRVVVSLGSAATVGFPVGVLGGRVWQALKASRRARIFFIFPPVSGDNSIESFPPIGPYQDLPLLAVRKFPKPDCQRAGARSNCFPRHSE
jgi:hypothetical protein